MQQGATTISHFNPGDLIVQGGSCTESFYLELLPGNGIQSSDHLLDPLSTPFSRASYMGLVSQDQSVLCMTALTQLELYLTKNAQGQCPTIQNAETGLLPYLLPGSTC